MLQPAPPPVSSSGVSVAVVVCVWSTPLRASDGNEIAEGVASVNEPLLHGPAYASIVPPAPTAQQRIAEGHQSPLRFCAVAELWDAHVLPPFVVARIVPVAPTAQHVVVLAHATPLSVFVVPDVCPDQVVPPFVVPR